MPTNTTELTATGKNIAEKVDQVTQLKVLGASTYIIRKSAKLHEILIVKKNQFF